jgi:hypothetical protein
MEKRREADLAQEQARMSYLEAKLAAYREAIELEDLLQAIGEPNGAGESAKFMRWATERLALLCRQWPSATIAEETSQLEAFQAWEG